MGSFEVGRFRLFFLTSISLSFAAVLAHGH